MTSGNEAAAKVAHARIVRTNRQGSLFDDTSWLIDLLSSGASVERYRRLWHIGGVELVDGRFLFGRLGFDRRGRSEYWDESRLDFEITDVPDGVASPFAVDVPTRVIVFQTRGNDIRVSSFTGALGSILNRSDPDAQWRIVPVRRERTFQQWAATVDSVNRIHANLERPNPNYEDRPDIENLIESLRAESALVDFVSDQGLQSDSALLDQLLDHVDRGYGNAFAVGYRNQNGERVESVYDTQMRGDTDVRRLPANPDTGEVARDTLFDELLLISQDASQAQADDQ